MFIPVIQSNTAKTTHLTARVPASTASRIEQLARDRAQTQTRVITELLTAGLDKLESDRLDEGFALLGDPEMQDMAFPTEPQKKAMRIAH